MAGGLSQGLLATVMLLASVMAKGMWSAEGRKVPALFIFGDSIVDVGNNNFLPRSTAKADFPPNGIDFPGGKPTGRFSNGYNTADYVAKTYGFKRSPPAFLSLTESELKKSICTGINFGSAGSGILITTGSQFGEVIPMDVQLDYFRSSLKSFRGRTCSTPRRVRLSKSVFILSFGSNDLFALYSSNASQTHRTASKFIATLTSKYKQHLKTLYRLGARRFGIIGLGQIGCCPFFRSLAPSGECIAVLDDYALQFNLALRQVVEKFSSKRGGMKYSFGDGQSLGKVIVGNPSAYGFKEYRSACCGGGRLNGESRCTANATLCSNRVDYYFWDWYHPTARVDKFVATMLYSGPPTVVTPINFAELAQD